MAQKPFNTNVPLSHPSWKQHGDWLWCGGFICVVTEDARNLEDMVDRAAAIAFQEGFYCGGEQFIVTAGVPFGTPGADEPIADCVCFSRWHKSRLTQMFLYLIHRGNSTGIGFGMGASLCGY